jgi:hypothetical protein
MIMKIFDIVEYRQNLAIITDLPTPTTCKVFFEEYRGKFNVIGAKQSEVEPLRMPEDFTRDAACESICLFQKFSQMLNLPTQSFKMTPTKEQIQADVAHIFESGANEIRVVELIERLMPRWISVDERLPHLAVGAEWTGLSHNCFVLGEGLPESMAYYSFNDMKWKCSVNTGEVLHGVTHWRPRT